ncbi:MAG: hypothetical protein KF746_11280 [Chitinophagaceae bacterium]|nr:hypothetical protein [Chitinophagaceae bacterium]
MKKTIFFLLAVIAIPVFFIRSKTDKQTADTSYNTTRIYCAPSFDPAKLNNDAPLLKGLGNFHYKVSTRSKKAQQYFNQGFALMYGFNHGEAARSFLTAIRYDSTLAMAYWGLAMVLGPNYNAPLDPAGLDEINKAVDKAVMYADKATTVEKALINAVTKKFPREKVGDMTVFYEAYAEAMRQAYNNFSNDADVGTLYAESLMNLHPWDLWLKDGSPQPWTPPIVETLESVLSRFPEHPGAIHYYIHATEASKQPGKAAVYADRLRDQMPDAGHLVHMPSHTYIRTGAYHKGVIANEKASEADSTYIAQCKIQGTYPLLYYPHNLHFLAACAFLEGNSTKALDAAEAVSRKADKKFLADNATVQHFYIIPLYVMIHTGKWDEILQRENPGEGLLYPEAIWHYARGMAYAAKGKTELAEKELAAIVKISENDQLKTHMIWDMNSAADLVNIARYVLEGELLAHNKRYDEAISLFNKAITVEDKLNYNEPPDWFFSVRLTAGHWMLQAGEFAAAEKIFREDLETFKENGWALMGLYKSLQGQARAEEANQAKERFDKAWQWADINIESSRKM